MTHVLFSCPSSTGATDPTASHGSGRRRHSPICPERAVANAGARAWSREILPGGCASIACSHRSNACRANPWVSLYATCEQMDVEVALDGLRVDFKYNLQTTPIASANVNYFVNHLGEIQVQMTYDGTEDLADMFKFGMDVAIPADFDTLTWRGFGPDETYADREFGARYGTFKNKVADNIPGYVVPQACGNHTGVRYAKVVNEAGVGICISGSIDQSLSFSALPYSAHELENAYHEFELPQVHKTVLSINLKGMGVGGDDSWGARPETMFDLPANQSYQLKFKIAPVK